jgi:hypothetical protein
MTPSATPENYTTLTDVTQNPKISPSLRRPRLNEGPDDRDQTQESSQRTAKSVFECPKETVAQEESR